MNEREREREGERERERERVRKKKKDAFTEDGHCVRQEERRCTSLDVGF